MSTEGPPPDRDRLAAARDALATAERAARAPDRPEASPTDGRSSAGDADATARQIVLRQLSVGPRTRKQLEDKLSQRGCDDDVARRVLDRMSEVGLVDDASFAEMLVRSRRATKGLAAPALQHELRQKGVPADIAERALEEVRPEHERASAEELVAKRLRTMHGLDREVQTRRLAGFLARKGYSAGVSYEVVRDALDALEEHRRD